VALEKEAEGLLWKREVLDKEKRMFVPLQVSFAFRSLLPLYQVSFASISGLFCLDMRSLLT
jgi:hypothetical protein